MLTIFLVDYEYYRVKVFVLQFPTVFTELLALLGFYDKDFENSLLDQTT